MTDELIRVPDIGGAEGAEVVEVLVAPGEAIDVEQSLIVVESDKASMEIPAARAGVVGELRVAVGDMVSEGDVILVIATQGAVDGEGANAAEVAAEIAPKSVGAISTEIAATDSAQANHEAHDIREKSAADASASDTSAGATGSIDVVIPDLGSDQGADLVEWLVEVGAAVEEGDSLVLLESDKASMEVPSPASGVLSARLIEDGATVNEGTVIARLDIVASAGAPSSSPAASEQAREGASAGAVADATQVGAAEVAEAGSPSPSGASAASHQTPAIANQGSQSDTTSRDAQGPAIYAGPAVRKLAREFGVSLAQVTGTGAKGRILKEDLQQYVARALQAPAASGGGGALPVIPDQDFARFGEVERVNRSRIDKLTATNMVRSWLNVPHVTQFDDADISGLERFRKDLKGEAAERGVRLTPLPFILKACAVALRDHPKLKSSLADGGDTLVMKRYCHIGMAVDTPAGLVVPVIRDVDKKSIWELASEVSALAERARDKQLKPDDMQGGVFTVSSLGAIGGRGFTPIINAPEVAILGVGRAAVQPVWDGEVFRPATMLPLALSYDHRVVNGGDGGRFLTDLAALLADVKRMVM
jgi:pyruvate dehydrogenase E2 component (dihydrolipoamide acetyltransferase)